MMVTQDDLFSLLIQFFLQPMGELKLASYLHISRKTRADPSDPSQAPPSKKLPKFSSLGAFAPTHLQLVPGHLLGRPTSKHHNSRLHLFSLAVTCAASGKCGVSSSVQDCSLRTVHFEGCKTQECQFCSSLNLGLNLQRPSIS